MAQETHECEPPSQLRVSDRAVTPVIGIILLVAIAVILASVVATFGLGLGDRVQDFAPNTRFSFDFDEDATGESCGLAGGGSDQGKLTITHESGDEIDESQLVLVDEEGNRASWNDCVTTSISTIGSGDQTTPKIDSDDTIRLVWKSENTADDTSVVATFEGPDA